jgi:hypothetical protein
MDCVIDQVARSLFLTAQHWVQSHMLHIAFVEGKTVQKQACLRLPPHTNIHSTPQQMSFYHYEYGLTYHHPLRCLIALTRQQIITSSVFRMGASSLTWH